MVINDTITPKNNVPLLPIKYLPLYIRKKFKNNKIHNGKIINARSGLIKKFK